QIRNLVSSAHSKMIHMPGKRTTRGCESDETSPESRCAELRRSRFETSPGWITGDAEVTELLPVCRRSGHNCARRRVVVPNAALFREIASHDSAPICRPLPWSFQNPASATSGPFDVGRVTGRPLNEDTQYRIRQFSARSSNQKQKS